MMKIHTTNYFNTFIEIAEDCPVLSGETPPNRGDKPTVAGLQHGLLSRHPYQYSSDDILFFVFALRRGIPEGEQEEQRQEFFSKGQPCFRASPLPKSFGWGVHSNSEGKIALYSRDSDEYARFLADDTVTKLKAMRSKRK